MTKTKSSFAGAKLTRTTHLMQSTEDACILSPFRAWSDILPINWTDFLTAFLLLQPVKSHHMYSVLIFCLFFLKDTVKLFQKNKMGAVIIFCQNVDWVIHIQWGRDFELHSHIFNLSWSMQQAQEDSWQLWEKNLRNVNYRPAVLWFQK